MKTARAMLAVLVLLAPAASAWGQADARKWTPLENDGLHDPRNPSLRLLQPPAEALRGLPPDTAGNQVRWVDALEKGAIAPRTSLDPERKVRTLDLDVYMDRYGSVPIVRFPHRQHTLWLDCSNCHDKLFLPKIGANGISMLRILQGEQCGQCHGAVAFPLTECVRCHNTPRTPENVARARKQGQP